MSKQIGALLKSKRESLKLTIEEVANQLKLYKVQIIELEEMQGIEDLSYFRKAHLRKYIDLLKLDKKYIDELSLSDLYVNTATISPIDRFTEESQVQAPTNKLSKQTLITFGLLFIVVIAVFLLLK